MLQPSQEKLNIQEITTKSKSYYISQFVCLFVCLSSNSSQTIGPTGFKFSGFDGGLPGVVIREFGEDWSKIQPVGQFFSKIPGWGHYSLCKHT